MDQKTGRHVYVALPEASPPSDIEVLRLLSAAEIDLSSVRFIRSGATEQTMERADALVMVLTNSKLADVCLESASLAAARAGVCNIVGVWAPDQPGAGIHPSGLRFTTAQIPWDSNKLKTELGSDCEHAFQTPDGNAATPNEIEPHECE